MFTDDTTIKRAVMLAKFRSTTRRTDGFALDRQIKTARKVRGRTPKRARDIVVAKQMGRLHHELIRVGFYQLNNINGVVNSRVGLIEPEDAGG